MKREEEVKPVVWPTEEPQIPPQPEREVAAEAAPDGEPMATAKETLAPPAEQTLPAGVQEGSTHAYVWENAAAAAGVVRTIIHRDEGSPTEGPLAGMSTRQVVAALMAGLGAEVGGAVVEQLRDEADVRWVGCAVAEEAEVTHAIALHALESMRQRIEAGDYLQNGGPGLARDLLEQACGANRARWLLRSESWEKECGFEMLKNVAPEQVAPFISHEHPQTISLVLSQLDPSQAAGILDSLPGDLQADVAHRISTMERITPAVLMEIDESLEASLRDILGGNQDVGGPKVLADILNMTGSSTRNVLDQMDANDPEVAEAVRNLMFTFADISKLTDRELQILLREVDQKDLVIALKAAEEELKDKILGNMSEQVRPAITEEMESLGPMRLSEVEEVQLRIVRQVRQLEEKGEITIVRGDADDSFV